MKILILFYLINYTQKIKMESESVDPEQIMYENSPNKDRTLDNVTFSGDTLITGPFRFHKDGDQDMTHD